MSFTIMKPLYLCNSLATCQLLGSMVKQQNCTGYGKPTVLAGGYANQINSSKSDCNLRLIPSFQIGI